MAIRQKSDIQTYASLPTGCVSWLFSIGLLDSKNNPMKDRNGRRTLSAWRDHSAPLALGREAPRAIP
jgi:hypothetical protein